MKVVTSITDQPRQNFIVGLENNEIIDINLYYYSSQNAWYYDFKFGDYVSQGNKVVLNINSLRYAKNILPFGIGFLSDTNADPFQLESFVNQDCQMVIWEKDDLQMLEDTVYNASK